MHLRGPLGTMAAGSSRMIGSGCAGLILHILRSVFFLVWLLLAIFVQLLTVSFGCEQMWQLAVLRVMNMVE